MLRERNLASSHLHASETTSFSQHLCSPNRGQIIILGTQDTSLNKTSTCLRAFIIFAYN